MLPCYSRILIVDDSATTRKAVRTMLEHAGFPIVDEASDGAQALQRIATIRYGLVISDWFMEPMSGIDLLRALRTTERGRRMPFIMMTAQNQKKFSMIARDTGTTHFLVKPFTVQMLTAKIGEIDIVAEVA